VLLPLTTADVPRVPSAVDVALPVRLYNPRAQALLNVEVKLASEYPTVALTRASLIVPRIEAGGVVDLSPLLTARFTAGEGYFEHTRLTLGAAWDGTQSMARDLDLLVAPEVIPSAWEVAVLDGRKADFTVFHQKGNQGGGNAIPRTVTEGKGNGNGVLEPGEEATIWVRLRQGLDPFDKGNWYRAKVYTDSKWVTEIADLEEQKQREWTSAKERTSVIRLSADAPAGTPLKLLLDSESWSFRFTPDVRYGQEPLYQAFQLHKRHLHHLEIVVPRREGSAP
jgi:hypothetical protein